MTDPTHPSAPTGDGGAGSSSQDVMNPRDAFAELGRIVLGEQPLGQVLQRVAELARACIPGADEVSVTLLEGEKPEARSAAFTGRLAAALDERQYEAGFGPCMDAAQSGRSIRVDDTATESVYPDFADVARRHGVRGVVSIGLPMPQRVLGGINVYRLGGGPLDEAAVELLRVFASYASVSVANASLFASTAALAGQLQQAMQSRAVIDQAQGVLVARLHCTPEEAFQHLVKLSQGGNRKLRDLAAEIVERAARG